MTLDEIAGAVVEFFGTQMVASLILPDGWFGRPHDNMHELTGCIPAAGRLRVELDGQHVLSLEGIGTSMFWQPVAIDGARALRVAGFTRLDWDWREYGSGAPTRSVFAGGDVTFVAPFEVVPPAPAHPTH